LARVLYTGKRGPKPVDLGLLNTWEFEFYKAFHLLRDGSVLPRPNLPPPLGFKPSELRALIARLKRMTPEDYWHTQGQLARELGEKVNLQRPPRTVDRLCAERNLKGEIVWLEQALNSPKVQAQVRRRKIWNDFVRATTYSALRKACGRWSRIPDVRAAGMTLFPAHIVGNAEQFLFMKRNKRFPRSHYGDNSRIEYLARGMAGVLVGVSPMTAIERLRNMKHELGGPLWGELESRCKCWRCSLNSSNEVSKMMQGSYENSLRKFIEVADKIKQQRS
jgi:hypothetical protein